MRLNFYWFIIIVLCFYSCKTLKTTSPTVTASANLTEEIIDTLKQKKETLPSFWITKKNDTLYSLLEEIEINIERLLPDTFSVFAVGDIMNGTNYPNSSYLPPNMGKTLWGQSSDLLSHADITFGNLEGTLLDGEGNPKNCNNPKACYLFRMPGYMASNLHSSGFDLLSTANNHANDFGLEGREATAQILDSIGINHAGSTDKHFTIIKKNHLKIGLIAFAPNKGTLTFYDENYAIELISKLDSLVDILLISIHGGAEGAKNQHVKNATEYYYGENRGNIYAFSRLAIDHGADLIIGHGPHVPRAIDVYKNKLIAYSLGNFLTYGRFNLKNENALAPILELNLNSQGAFLDGRIHSFIQSYSLGPLKDSKMRASKKIKKLSEEDFPDSQIIIDEEGIISYLQN